MGFSRHIVLIWSLNTRSPHALYLLFVYLIDLSVTYCLPQELFKRIIICIWWLTIKTTSSRSLFNFLTIHLSFNSIHSDEICTNERLIFDSTFILLGQGLQFQINGFIRTELLGRWQETAFIVNNRAMLSLNHYKI